MVKYRDAIDAYWKVNNSTINLKSPGISIVKSGVEAYEVGKGKPKQTKADKDSRIYHSKVKKDDTYRPYIDGNNVSRYKLSWNGEYIKYGPNLAAMRDPRLFEGERILVRQIPSKKDYSIEATATKADIINDRNSMIITGFDKVAPLALLGVINSKILTLWFLIRFDKFQRRIFPQFKINELELFPIPVMSQDMQSKISSTVELIMNKVKNKESYSKENTKVDELVMTAFGLNENEKEAVRKFEF